jgi:hypothetical protein
MLLPKESRRVRSFCFSDGSLEELMERLSRGPRRTLWLAIASAALFVLAQEL